MKAKIIPLDDKVTDLVIAENGFYIRWAGCLFGPSPTLEAICTDSLLDFATRVYKDPKTVWKETEFQDFDNGLGLVEIEPYKPETCLEAFKKTGLSEDYYSEFKNTWNNVNS